MTVVTENRKQSFETNGVTVNFPFDFNALDTSEIYAFTVDADGKEDDYTNFSVVLNTSTAGGTLTTGDVLNDVELWVYRTTDQTQEVDYINGGRFPADSHEQALDKLTQISQEQQEEIDRSLKSSISQPLPFTLDPNLADEELLLMQDSVIKSSGTTVSELNEAIESAEQYRNQSLGAYELPNKTFEKLGQYVIYSDNQAYWPIAGTPLPYTTDIDAYPNPNDDPSLELSPNVTIGIVNKAIEDTTGALGAWNAGSTTFNRIFDYSIFNDIKYQVKDGVSLPYTAQGADPTALPDSDFVEPFIDTNSSNSTVKFSNVADMKASSSLIAGNSVSWDGYADQKDGGSGRGVVKEGAHTSDDGVIFSINASLYVEADVGLSIRSAQFGVFPGATDSTQLDRWFSYCYINRVPMLAYPGTYNVTSPVFNDASNFGSLSLKCLTSEAVFNYTGAETLAVISTEGLDDCEMLNIRVNANDLSLRPFSLRNTLGTPSGGVELTNVYAENAKETAISSSVFGIFIDGEYTHTTINGGGSINASYTTPGNAAAATAVNNASGIISIKGHTAANVSSPDGVNADGIVLFGNGIGDVTIKMTARAEVSGCKVSNCIGRFIKVGISDAEIHHNHFSLSAPLTLNPDWRGIDIQAGNGNIHSNTHDYDAGIVTDTESTIYVLQNIRDDGTNKSSFVHNERISTGTPIRTLASCFSRYKSCSFSISDIDIKGSNVNFGVRHQTFGLGDTDSMSVTVKGCKFDQILDSLFSPFDNFDYGEKLHLELTDNEDIASPFSDLIDQAKMSFGCSGNFRFRNNAGIISRANWIFDMNNLNPGSQFYTGSQVIPNAAPGMSNFFHVDTASFVQRNITTAGTSEQRRTSTDGVTWNAWVAV